MNIGTRVAVMRAACRITQWELSQMCCIVQGAISMIETDKREPTPGQLSDIRTALRWGPEVDKALDGLETAIMREADDGH